jgi:hypothetical protein
MSVVRSSPEMKICEINDQAGERRPVVIMEQSKPVRKLVRPTYRIPEWSSRAEEEYICVDVGCSPARKENRDDLCCGRAMRRDRRGEDVPGGLRHDRTSRGEARTKMRRFGTIVAELESLRDWLKQEGVTHVVMESTASYWKPGFNILEADFQVYLANPQEVKNRKGHKTHGLFIVG